MSKIITALQFMLDTANNNAHGYDQTNRNGPDYDCSSLIGTALNYAGFAVSKSSWTGNLASQLDGCGFKKITNINDRKPGDIFLTPGKHVVMCVDSDRIVHASINEKGSISGGQPGDQTGKEICTRDFYIPSYGWEYHYRYTGDTASTSATLKDIDTVAREVIAGKWANGVTRVKKLTAAGYVYTDVQARVNSILSGKTLKSNEEIAREVVRGLWGNGDTRKKNLTSAGYNYDAVQSIVNKIA